MDFDYVLIEQDSFYHRSYDLDVNIDAQRVSVVLCIVVLMYFIAEMSNKIDNLEKVNKVKSLYSLILIIN